MEDVKQHKWFRGVDWDAVLQRKLVVGCVWAGLLSCAAILQYRIVSRCYWNDVGNICQLPPPQRVMHEVSSTRTYMYM